MKELNDDELKKQVEKQLAQMKRRGFTDEQARKFCMKEDLANTIQAARNMRQAGATKEECQQFVYAVAEEFGIDIEVMLKKSGK